MAEDNLPVRPVFKAAESKPLVEVDMKSIDLGEKMLVPCLSMEPDKPNANGDAFTKEAIAQAHADFAREGGYNQPVTHVTRKPTDAEIAAHQAKHKISGRSDWVDLGFGNYQRWNSFTRRTLTKPHTRDFAWGCRATLYPDRTLTLVQIADPTKPFEIVGLGLEKVQELVEFLNCPMAPDKPFDFKAMEERITKVLADAKASGKPLEVFSVDSISPTGRMTGKSTLMTEITKQNPCATVTGRGKSTLTYDTLKTMGNWKHQKEKVPGETDKGLVEREVTFAQATAIYMAADQATPVDQITRRMWWACMQSLPVLLPTKHIEYLIPPRYQICYEGPMDEMRAKEDYAPDQVFLCQKCGQTYRYGTAKAEMASAASNRLNHAYHPLLFCSTTHEDEYLAEKRMYPVVGAEIPLGEPQMCNLVSAVPESASKGDLNDPLTGKAVGKVYTEYHHLPGDSLGLDALARSMGMEPIGPTHVVEQKVTLDDTAPKE